MSTEALTAADARETRTRLRRTRFHDSLADMPSAPKHGGPVRPSFSLPVVLISSENPYLPPGSRGVLTVIEQGVDLSVIVATFRRLDETTHALGLSVQCRRPIFVYSPISHEVAP